MKKLLTGALLICAIGLSAQTENKAPSEKPNASTYCIVLKDGVTVLIKDGKQVFNDVELDNGTRITSTGQVTKKDGTQFVLKQDECVDGNGMIARPVARSEETAKPGPNTPKK